LQCAGNFPALVQLANALLVAGPTLTLWIPGQTVFASTSSYSRRVKGCLYNSSLQLMHSISQDTQ